MWTSNRYNLSRDSPLNFSPLPFKINSENFQFVHAQLASQNDFKKGMNLTDNIAFHKKFVDNGNKSLYVSNWRLLARERISSLDRIHDENMEFHRTLKKSPKKI